MKKYRVISAVLTMVMVLCALTGCGIFKPTSASLMKQTMKNLENVTSLKSHVTADYEGKASYGGMDISVPLTLDCDMETVTEPGINHLSGTIGTTLPLIGDLSVPIESYQQMEEGDLVAYTSIYGTGWFKSQSKQDASDSAEGTKPALNPLAGLGILQKIASGELKAELAEETEMLGEKEVYRMDIAISGDLMNEMLAAAIEAEGEESEKLQNIDMTGGDANIVLYIGKEDKLPAKAVIDCTALGNVLMQNMSDAEGFTASADKFIITMEISEYNTIDELKIPEEVTSSATEEEDFDLFESLQGA